MRPTSTPATRTVWPWPGCTAWAFDSSISICFGFSSTSGKRRPCWFRMYTADRRGRRWPCRRSRGSRFQCLRMAKHHGPPPKSVGVAARGVQVRRLLRLARHVRPVRRRHVRVERRGRLDLARGEVERVHALDVEHRRVGVVHAALAGEAHEAAVDLLAHEVARVAVLDARDLRLHERHQHVVGAGRERAQLREERHQARVQLHEARAPPAAGRRRGPSARSAAPGRAACANHGIAAVERRHRRAHARAAPRARRSAASGGRRSARRAPGSPRGACRAGPARTPRAPRPGSRSRPPWC